MFDAPHDTTLAPFDGTFDLAAFPTIVPERPDEDDLEDRLDDLAKVIRRL